MKIKKLSYVHALSSPKQEFPSIIWEAKANHARKYVCLCLCAPLSAQTCFPSHNNTILHNNNNDNVTKTMILVDARKLPLNWISLLMSDVSVSWWHSLCELSDNGRNDKFTHSTGKIHTKQLWMNVCVGRSVIAEGRCLSIFWGIFSVGWTAILHTSPPLLSCITSHNDSSAENTPKLFEAKKMAKARMNVDHQHQLFWIERLYTYTYVCVYIHTNALSCLFSFLELD